MPHPDPPGPPEDTPAPAADIHLDVAKVESALSPDVRTIGTIEGELKGSIIHGEQRFLLYDSLTGRKVICYFGDTVSWEALRDVFSKRLAVTGHIRSRPSGDRASIKVSSFYVFPSEDELPTADDVRGLLTRFCMPGGYDMCTMNISLPQELKSFVDEQVASRGYRTSSEYLRELLRRDRDRQHLRRLLLEGADSPQGPFADDAWFDSLRERARGRQDT